MMTLKTFSKSEQAYLFATFLESQGVTVNVVDDNAFGGNALGAIKGAVRVEVAEEDFAAAKEVADDWER